MRFTKSALLVVITVIISSVFVAKVSNLINVGGSRTIRQASGGVLPQGKQRRYQDDFGVDKDHLMVFLQVKSASKSSSGK